MRLWHGFGPGQRTGTGRTGFMNRILIVSDDIFLRDMVRLSLADMRTEVRCAADAGEMERLCRRVLFDLVIVLHAAPFLRGRDVVRSIRPAGLKRPLFYVCLLYTSPSPRDRG